MDSVKKWLISALLTIIIVASFAGSLRQIITLKGISDLLGRQKTEIAILEAKKAKLVDQIAYASTEEYRQRAYRWYLGLGSENDYWLNLPPNHRFETIYETSGENAVKPNWQQWLELIVDQR